VTGPDRATQDVVATLADPQTGRYSADVRVEETGVYRIRAVAERGGAEVGNATRSLLVGGADLEMADPRLNDEVLRRIAVASGGSYLTADEADRLPSLLASAVLATTVPQLEELWHNIWIFSAFILCLATEWMLRRRWGLR
jgi:hypothetical protein